MYYINHSLSLALIEVRLTSPVTRDGNGTDRDRIMGDPTSPRTIIVNIRPRPAPEPPRPVLPLPAPKIEDLLLLAWWLHARSRIAGGLRRRDTVQV